MSDRNRTCRSMTNCWRFRFGRRKLAEGEYVTRSEPVIFLGETGTGKTHLSTALAVAACQHRRVRFATAAELVNELVDAREKA